MDKKTLQQLKQLRKKLHSIANTPQKRAAREILLSDHELFERAMIGVKPLTSPAQFLHPASPISPWPRKNSNIEQYTAADDMSDFWPWDELEQGEQLMFAKPGLRLDLLKKLKKGGWPIDAQLDLHGETVDSARLKVANFLQTAMAHQYKCVRIIHGKGLSSKEGVPILKLKLKNWLAQRAEVLAFVQAKPAQGCAGAVLVLLKGKQSP